MKLIFNDATELIIQSADIQSDGGLLIKTISASEEDLKTMFQDQTKTKKMVVKERESTLGEYENYTNMDAIVKYTAGITGVILYKVVLKNGNIGIRTGVTVEKACYELAWELSHAFIHYRNGDMIRSPLSKDYNEQATRSAELILKILNVKMSQL